jgi:hypothetical protein
MKKVLAIALIAGSLAACNNNGDKKETKDTTRVDSPAVVTPTPDTTMAPADTTKMSDTTHM